MTGAIVPPKNLVQTWERYCIEVPLPTQEWRALITGALLDLGYGYYYDKSTGDWEYARDLGKEIVSRWGERVGCGSLCQFVLTAIQNSPDVNTFLLLIIKELIRSCTQDIIDTFQEWFDGIDFGNGDYDDREDRTKARKRTGTDGDEKRCLAAENAAEVFYRLHVQSLTEIIDDINPFALMTALGSVLASYFGFTPNMVFFASIASAIAVVGLTGTKELFTEGVKDELKCIFYRAYDNTGGISEGNWNDLQDALDNNSETKPFPEATMWALLSIYVKMFAGYRGTVTAGASTFITSGECTDCGWGKFADYTVGNFGATAAPGMSVNRVDGEGFEGGDSENLDRVFLTLAFDSAYVTSIHVMRTDGEATYRWLCINSGTVSCSHEGEVSTSWSKVVGTDVTVITFGFEKSATSTPWGYITGLKIFGNGDIPSQLTSWTDI